MATIAQLLVKLSGDNSDLKRSLLDSADQARRFVSTVEGVVQKARTNLPLIQVPGVERLDELNLTIGRMEDRLAGITKTANGVRDATGRFISPDLPARITDTVERLKLLEVEQLRLVETSAKPFLQTTALASVNAYINTMKEQLANNKLAINEQALQGLLTPEQSARAGQLAALAYNETLMRTMAELNGSTVGLTAEMRASIESAMSQEGVKAGELLGRGIATGVKESTAQVTAATQQMAQKTNYALTNAGGAFSTFGRRGATSLVGLGFGIESFANGTQAGMRRALRSVETFALFFGPEGLLVAGLITGGLAVFDFFHKAEQRAEESAKKMAQIIVDAANTADTLVQLKQLQEVQQGKPFQVIDDKPVRIAPSTLAPGSFRGSLNDLNAEIAINQRNLDTFGGRVNHETVAMQQHIDNLKKQAKPLQELNDTIVSILKEPPPEIRLPQLAEPVTIKAKTGKAEAAAEAQRLALEQQILLRQFEINKESGKSYAVELTKLIVALANLGAESRRTGETLKQYEVRLNSIKTLTEALNKLSPKVEVKVMDWEEIQKMLDTKATAKATDAEASYAARNNILTQFEDLVKLYDLKKLILDITNAQLLAEGKKAVGDTTMAPLQADIAKEAARIQKALLGLGIPLGIVQLILDKLGTGLKNVGNVADATARKLANINKEMGKIAAVGNSLASLNDAVGGSNRGSEVLQQASAFTSSVGSAIQQGGTNPAADIQALADGVKLLRTTFGETREIWLEHKEILKANSERLREVGLRLAGFSVSAGNSVEAGKAVSALFANNAALQQLTQGSTHAGGLLGTQTKGDLQTQINALTPFLQSVGLTFDQFKKIASDSGINVFDKQGRIIVDALDLFRQHIEDVTKSLFIFQNTLNDQKSLADIQNQLSGRTTSGSDLLNRQNQLKSDIELIQKLAPKLIPGVDTSTVTSSAGLIALRQTLSDLVAKLAAGTIKPGDFGGFQNLQELLSAIDAVTKGMLGLSSTLVGTIDALTNVPQGFKVALYRFQAINPNGPLPFPLPQTPSGPPPTTTPWGGGGGGPAGGGSGVLPIPALTINVGEGAIVVRADASVQPEDLGRKVLLGLQTLAISKLGRSADWSKMN